MIVKLNRSLLALLCAAMFAGLVYAEDAPAPEKKEAPKTEKKERPARPARLTKPWSLLDDLKPEQKEAINKIHLESLAEKKKIDDKEEADCMALLTDAQKEELQKALDKEKAEMKEKNKKPAKSTPATKPAE